MLPVQLDHDPLPDRGSGYLSSLALLLARTRVTSGKAEIVPGLDLAWSVSLDRSGVDVSVLVRGIVVWTATLDRKSPSQRLEAHQGLFKEDIELEVDLAGGVIRLAGDVWLRTRAGWHCQHFPPTVLVAWSPTLGAVGGRSEAHPPQVDDPVHGRSCSIVPTILRIPIDTTERAGTPVGSMVKRALFPREPDFLFNVCFAVGPFKPFFPGVYGDPTSIWFNVFAGYYEIDCARPAWTRPFGYDLSPDRPTVNFDDIVRIAKADGSFFSSWMYGVPGSEVDLHVRPDPETRCEHLGRHRVASSEWDLVDVDGFSAVSVYESAAPGAAQLVDNTPLSQLWRVMYGEPSPRSGHDASFPGTRMHARLFMAFSADETMYRTYLFGGTVNKAFGDQQNAQLMERQTSAVQKVMTDHYPTLGFPLSVT